MAQAVRPCRHDAGFVYKATSCKKPRLTALAVPAIADIVDVDNNCRQDHDGAAVHSDRNALEDG